MLLYFASSNKLLDPTGDIHSKPKHKCPKIEINEPSPSTFLLLFFCYAREGGKEEDDDDDDSLSGGNVLCAW